MKNHGCLYTFLALLLFFIALSVFLEIAIPMRLESLIADQIQEGQKLRDRPVVRINMRPALYNILIGRVKSVYIKAKDVQAKEGFVVETAEVSITGVKFNTLRALRTRQPEINSIDGGQIKVVLSEKAVNDLVGIQLPGSKVVLEKDKVVYTGDLPYMLPGFTFTVSGKVTVLPDNILAFSPVLDEVMGLPVTQEIKDYLADALAIEYRVTELPDSVILTDVETAPGKMTVKASISSLDEIIQSPTGGS